jgi:transglutaminase-like putative cysteine protease
MASVASNRSIADPEVLEQLTLTIGGVSLENVNLHGGRQQLVGRTLTITKESLDGLPEKLRRHELALLEKIFLDPGPFIQADHPAIVKQARSIVDIDRDSPLAKARKLIDWMQRNIDKRPVLSVPDALATFQNRVGDCNEFAVLMAALARAAGVPARVEAGLVYLDGRFYYHAWNQLFVGRWVTADALYGQLPADVTHIRFSVGTRDQLDLMGLIGKVELEIVE